MLGLVDNASQSILVLLSSNKSIAFGFVDNLCQLILLTFFS
jgi:hypothetical protein